MAMNISRLNIIDVGCGNNPIEQAGFLLDKYSEENIHRRGDLKIPAHAVFVEGDVQDMRMFDDN